MYCEFSHTVYKVMFIKYHKIISYHEFYREYRVPEMNRDGCGCAQLISIVAQGGHSYAEIYFLNSHTIIAIANAQGNYYFIA